MSLSRALPLLALCLTALFVALFVWGGLQVKLMTLPEPWLPAPDSLQPELVSLPENVEEVDSEILERPLFWAGRRPYVQTEAEVIADEPVRKNGRLDKARLLGVFMTGGSAGVILEVDGSRERLLVGEVLGEWELLYMNSTGAVFGKGMGEDKPVETRTLQLEHAYPSASSRSPQVAVDRQRLRNVVEGESDASAVESGSEG